MSTQGNKQESYYHTEAAADGALQAIFGQTDKTSLSVDEVYASLGDKANSKKWFYNRLFALRRFGYVNTTKTDDGRNKDVILTESGIKRVAELKSARGVDTPAAKSSPATDVPAPTSKAPSPKSQVLRDKTEQVTPETIYRDIRLLREQLPSFNIVFKIEPKESPME